MPVSCFLANCDDTTTGPGADVADTGEDVRRDRDLADVTTVDAQDAAEEEPPGIGFEPELVRIGNPTWELEGIVQFSAPLGTDETEFREGVLMLTRTLLPDETHRFDEEGFFGPGEPHAGPYGDELELAVAAAGFESTRSFTEAQFTPPRGVYLMGVVLPGPGAPTGSSPDFESGPILPNALFPIALGGRLERDAEEADSSFDGVLPGAVGVEGHSHVIVFFADSLDSFSQAGGAYEWEMELVDRSGAGWILRAAMAVE